MQDIKDIVKHLAEQAKKQMLKKGELEPKMYFLILYPGQKTAVYFPVPVSKFFEDGPVNMKPKIPAYAQMAWLNKKNTSPPGIELKAVCCMTDSWFSIYDLQGLSDQEIELLKDTAPMPSQDPNNIEAIQLSVCMPAKEGLVYLIPYKRKGKKLIFDETAKYEKPGHLDGGWMAKLFPKIL